MKKYLIFLFIPLLAALSSCNEFIEGDNLDPNSAPTAPMEAVLNAALVSTVLGQEGEDARLGCLWSRQFSGSDRQYSSLDIYIVSAGNFTWDKYYVAAQNAKIAAEEGEKVNNKIISGVGKIIRALALGTVVAGWGDAPVKEANDLLRYPHPKYDKQADAYAQIQAILDGAIADLASNPSFAPFVAKDFFYNGNAGKWSKLAHTLKARYYLHVKDYDAAIANGAKGILSKADNFNAPHGDAQSQNLNIYYDFGKLNREGYMTAENAYLYKILDPADASYRGNSKTDETARFKFIYDGAKDLNYKGMWAPNAPFTIAGAAETHLIMAEAYSRTGNNAKALEHLNLVRKMHADEFGAKYDDYALEDFQAGGIAAVAGKSESESLLYEIIEEKYCSLVGQHEVFNDIKRTKNLIGIQPTAGQQLPQRFLYPEVELNTNRDNIPKPLPTLYDPTPINR